MKLAGLGKLYSMLYNDKMDIFRTDSVESDDYTTDISYLPEPKYADVPCRISFESDDRGSDSAEDRNPVRFDPKIFCASSVDLRAGDFVTVRRYADNGQVVKTYSGRVSMPSWYTTHQEAFMRIDEGA